MNTFKQAKIFQVTLILIMMLFISIAGVGYGEASTNLNDSYVNEILGVTLNSVPDGTEIIEQEYMRYRIKSQAVFRTFTK